MNMIEDEPRKHPKPVPFCQSPLLQPTVPEVSLILQDKFDDRLPKKSESFSGTEFQTYNSWKWKQVNLNEKPSSSESKSTNKCMSIQDCCLIKDKYASSDIEKRKNEILYGLLDEPRRPLPPRANPVIPKCPQSFFSNSSFSETELNEEFRERHCKEYNLLSNQEKIVSKNQAKILKEVSDESEKLYNIISKQNKQVEVLQKQIDQLLKLQEVKDKQIEQLLKSQESKEKKIEQLLLSLETKDKEVEQLLRLKEKQEQQLQELIKSQEVNQKENIDMLKKLKEMQRKDFCTVGVMTKLEMFNASTNTSFDCYNKENCQRKDEDAVEGEISCIRDLNETRVDGKEKYSLSLHSSDLPLIQEHMPTPQSSIHVDIQDFHDSSDESDNNSRALSNNSQIPTEIHSSPLGYTFYNNVLTQVQDIIQKSGEKENEGKVIESNENVTNKSVPEYNHVSQGGTVQSIQTWGVFERENIPLSNKVPGRTIYPERFQYETPNAGVKESYSPSDISLKINALALKYLKQEQISQYDIPPQIPNSCQRDVTIYNVTNLSFGSMRYMDRYQIFPKVKETQQEVNIQQNRCSPAQLVRRKKKISLQENFTPPMGNILDISTLNQQPKLL